MRIADPYLNSLQKYGTSSKGWSAILAGLIQASNHSEQLFSFCLKTIPSLEDTYLTDAQTDVSKKNYSLDETLSSKLLTPFHLSFFDKSPDISKQIGQFFTPSYISRFIAMTSLAHFTDTLSGASLVNELLEMKLADLAVGTGNLLISLLYQVLEKLKPLTEDKRDLLHDFLSTNLYGFDLDPFALFISKLRVFLFSSLFLPDHDLPNLEENFCLGNSLLKSTINNDSSKVAFKPVKFFDKKDSLHFDIIVSNPPYMSYGLREAQKYHPKFKQYLRKNFHSAEYKLSLYPIFIERSLELLNDNGILGIITPDSHLLGRYYSKIRSHILSNSEILDISLLGFEPFKGVTVGRPTISFLKKTDKKTTVSSDKSFPVRWISSQEDFIREKWEEFGNFQTDFHSTDHNRFHLYFNKQDKGFVEDWKGKCLQKIEDVVTVHTGVRSKIGQKKIISNRKESDTWKRGIISGNQVKPFHLEYRKHWLNIDPSILWSGGFNPEIVENPKIIMRQTGYHIKTAVDTTGYYHLNNCHSVSPKNEQTNLFALAVILNSPEFNRVYSILSLEKGRSLAQIDIDFLLKIPILKLSTKEEKRLEEFYFKQKEKQEQKKELLSYSILENI
ncbi:MAG: N-6 DNA methylase [Candidatus Heimdallarchaeota archaeon]|nr:N-6 DNA methylase [Candidatus Heimdallarchaeota archaeon]